MSVQSKCTWHDELVYTHAQTAASFACGTLSVPLCVCRNSCTCAVGGLPPRPRFLAAPKLVPCSHTPTHTHTSTGKFAGPALKLKMRPCGSEGLAPACWSSVAARVLTTGLELCAIRGAHAALGAAAPLTAVGQPCAAANSMASARERAAPVEFRNSNKK